MFAPLDGIEGKAKGSGPQIGAAWSAIARTYAYDYIAIVALMVVTVICEGADPFHKVVYSKTDQELWRYSYPLHTANTVPAWLVPVIATLGPIALIVAWAAVCKPSRLELHNLILGLLASVFITATATNLVKLSVGRPRPNFVARCWPEGKLQFDGQGVPVCEEGAVDPGEGRKSFPSGHTSWSTSGLAYLTFFLAGKLRCFDGSGHPGRMLLASLPLDTAIWIGITRLQDYWHHVEDVLVGFVLGLTIAYMCYRQHYPSPLSPKSGEALASTVDHPGEVSRPRSFVDLEAADGGL